MEAPGQFRLVHLVLGEKPGDFRPLRGQFHFPAVRLKAPAGDLAMFRNGHHTGQPTQLVPDQLLISTFECQAKHRFA